MVENLKKKKDKKFNSLKEKWEWYTDKTILRRILLTRVLRRTPITRILWQQKWQKNSSVIVIGVIEWEEKLD